MTKRTMLELERDKEKEEEGWERGGEREREEKFTRKVFRLQIC